MASEMVERVAQALWEAQAAFPGRATWERLHATKRAVMIGMAKAAMGAMREPTDPMLHGARDWSVARYGRGVGNDDATGCFRAMMDAALKEPAA